MIALLGIGATFAAQLSMGDSWRIGVDDHERTELVTRGAFGFARNPILTAMAITAAGLAAMVPNVNRRRWSGRADRRDRAPGARCRGAPSPADTRHGV